MTSSSEARLTEADRADIVDLYGRYALAIDLGDGSGWAECLTTNGTFTANRGEGVAPRHLAGRCWLFERRVVTHDRLRP